MISPILRRLQVGVFVSASALLLVACSAGGSGAPSSDAADAPAEAADGGTVVVTTAQGAIPQLDPGLATLQWERVLYPLLWSGLTEVEEGDNVVPGLAEEWTYSDDLKTWTFSLRDGVTFTNGRDLTGEDIVWNVERTIDPKNASVAHNYLKSVEKVTVEGDSDIVFTLSEPDAVLPLALSSLRIIAPESEEDINTNPVGTGPYMVKSFVPNQSLKLVPNEDYWGTKASLTELQIETSNDTSAAVTALRTGDIHVLWNLPTADAKPLNDDASVALVQSDQPTQLHYLAIDTTSPPFDDVRARQALSYALDRDATKQVAYSGFGDAANYNELLPQKSWAFDAEGLTDYTFDLDKASQLFSEAGVNKGDTLTWWGIAGSYPEWNKEAQVLQQNLAEIGITLEIDNNEIGTWVDKFVPIGKKYGGYIIPNAGGDLNDPSFTMGRLVGGACECNYNSDVLNQLAAQGKATAGEDERAPIYQEMQRIVSTDVPEVFSLHVPLITAVRSNVTGIWKAPSGDLHLEGAALTKE